MKWAMIAFSVAIVFAADGCKSPSQGGKGFSGQSTNGTLQASRQTAPSGASFDFYLLNLSWSPEFCHGHPTAIECAAHATFVLHGLWPQNTDGTYPENCSNANGPSDP